MLGSTCPGCGLTALRPAGPPPAPAPERHTASDACWSLYGELLARSYADADYRRVHQLVVDAYTAEHAGLTGRRDVQLVGLCLMTLCLFVEDGVDPAEGPALHQRMMATRPDFSWLAPPHRYDLLTVADVLTAQDAAQHQRLVREWARQVWEAWAEHHATIRAWNAYALGLG